MSLTYATFEEGDCQLLVLLVLNIPIPCFCLFIEINPFPPVAQPWMEALGTSEVDIARVFSG